jgi:hypothetical protein
MAAELRGFAIVGPSRSPENAKLNAYFWSISAGVVRITTAIAMREMRLAGGSPRPTSTRRERSAIPVGGWRVRRTE